MTFYPMGKHFDFIDRLQARTALLAIGRSALRNRGAAGVVVAARKYCRGIDLRDFAVANGSDFSAALDKHTEKLMERFPKGARNNWGAARKALNIFLRDVLYSQPLCRQYGLRRLERWLGLPLDSHAYDGLVEDSRAKRRLPKWPGVKGLDSTLSATIQAAAARIAGANNTRRVHLDVKYWRKGPIDELEG
jgi:hypothetical protein